MFGFPCICNTLRSLDKDDIVTGCSSIFSTPSSHHKPSHCQKLHASSEINLIKYFLLVSWRTPLFHGSFAYIWTKNSVTVAVCLGVNAIVVKHLRKAGALQQKWTTCDTTTPHGEALPLSSTSTWDLFSKQRGLLGKNKMAWHIFGIVPLYPNSPFKFGGFFKCNSQRVKPLAEGPKLCLDEV